MLSFFDFLAWEQASKDTIDFKKIYVDMAKGDLKAGLMLSEIVFWHLPNKEGKTKLRVWKDDQLWIACRRYEWWERTRMSPKEADRSLSILCDEEQLCVKDLFKFDGEVTVHVRLNQDKFLEKLERVIKTPILNPFLPKVKIENDEKVKTDLPIEENPITETTTETTKISLPVAATGKRRNDWRGNTPIAPSGEASTTNESKAYRSLELYILKAMKKQKLTDPQRESLWSEVRIVSRGEEARYPSPVDLYEDNEQFRVFAEEKVDAMVNSSSGKVGATGVVDAIRSYEHVNGWLAYQLKQGGPVTPERSSETPSEPVKSGFVPGERFKL